MGKLPESFDDWKWPWTLGEVDEEKAARLVFNARKAEEGAVDKIKAKDEEISTLTAELDTAKAGKSGTDAEAQQELADLRKENRDLKAAQKPGRSDEDQREIDRLRVGLSVGLSERDTERLRGKTREEFEEDAKEFAKEHNIELRGGDVGDDDGDNRQDDRPGFGLPAFRTGRLKPRGGAAVREDPSKIELPPLT